LFEMCSRSREGFVHTQKELCGIPKKVWGFFGDLPSGSLIGLTFFRYCLLVSRYSPVLLRFLLRDRGGGGD
jgi:hypothetical protein